MNIQIQGLYFKGLISVTPELLHQIWDFPETVGGGATSFNTKRGTVWKTEEGWGFSRSGNKATGWVNLHDPNPSQGEYAGVPLKFNFRSKGK